MLKGKFASRLPHLFTHGFYLRCLSVLRSVSAVADDPDGKGRQSELARLILRLRTSGERRPHFPARTVLSVALSGRNRRSASPAEEEEPRLTRPKRVTHLIIFVQASLSYLLQDIASGGPHFASSNRRGRCGKSRSFVFSCAAP